MWFNPSVYFFGYTPFYTLRTFLIFFSLSLGLPLLALTSLIPAYNLGPTKPDQFSAPLANTPFASFPPPQLLQYLPCSTPGPMQIPPPKGKLIEAPLSNTHTLVMQAFRFPF